MDAVVEVLFELDGWPVHAAVAVLVFLESAVLAGLFLPGETALLAAGLLAGAGNVSLAVLLPVAVAAALAGDQVGYSIGRYFGPLLRRSAVGRMIGASRWEKALKLIDRRGATAVFAARWITVVRAVVPTAAGMVGMPRRKFFLANSLGAATWAPTVVLVGYVLGDSVARAEQVLAYLPVVGLITVVLMIAAAGTRTVRTRRHAAREPVGVDRSGSDGDGSPGRVSGSAARSRP